MTHETRTIRRRAHALAALAALVSVAAGLAGCDDDPFSFEWDDTPATAVLYSLDRPELTLPSGFNFVEKVAVLVQAPGATGNWDVALDTQGGSLALLPPGALGVTGTGAIATIADPPFDEVTEAPGDTLLYVSDAPVTLEASTTYVVRTNRRQGNFGASCVYYAKLEPVVLDVAGGMLTFRYVASPICNSREFVSPD